MPAGFSLGSRSEISMARNSSHLPTGSATHSTVMICCPPEGMEPNPGYTVNMPWVKRACKDKGGEGRIEGRKVVNRVRDFPKELRDNKMRKWWCLSPLVASLFSLPGGRGLGCSWWMGFQDVLIYVFLLIKLGRTKGSRTQIMSISYNTYPDGRISKAGVGYRME